MPKTNTTLQRMQAPKKRIKSKAITMYVDPKYTDVIDYLKLTKGVTAFFEECLDKVKVDDGKLRVLQDLREMKKNAK
jgi:hypothetical protein